MIQYVVISGVGAGIGALVSKNKKKGALIGAGIGVGIHFISVVASFGETYLKMKEKQIERAENKSTEDEKS
jgi:hypothetical protein